MLLYMHKLDNTRYNMSRIVHLENGTAIKADIVETFDRAVVAEDNVARGVGSTDFWNFVEADMYMEHSGIYNSEYIQECFDTLADCWSEVDNFYATMFGKVA